MHDNTQSKKEAALKKEQWLTVILVAFMLGGVFFSFWGKSKNTYDTSSKNTVINIIDYFPSTKRLDPTQNNLNSLLGNYKGKLQGETTYFS